MVARLVTAALCALWLGCDPAEDRTRRDFEETGAADLGDIRARADPGVALVAATQPAYVRFRADAPALDIRFDSSAASDREVRVEVDNAHPGSRAEGASSAAWQAGRTMVFRVAVPAGGTAEVHISPPDAPADAPWRFAWVGDVQGGLERLRRVRARIAQDPDLDFTVFAGDLTEGGRASDLDEFIREAGQLPHPWYAVIGNHDTMGGGASRFQSRVGRLNVAFDWKGTRVILVDSASATLDSRAFEFLAEAVSTGPATRIVGMHVPPVDWAGVRDGGFASRAEGLQVMSLLGREGTDLLLAGHLHTLHYYENAGVPIVVSGNGGVGFEMAFDGTSTHFMKVSVDPLRELVTTEAVMVP